MVQPTHSQEVLPNPAVIKALKFTPTVKAFLIIFLCIVEEAVLRFSLQRKLSTDYFVMYLPLVWGLFFAGLVIVPLICRWSDRVGKRRILISCQLFVLVVLLLQSFPIAPQIALGIWILINVALVVLPLMIPVMFDVALSATPNEAQTSLMGKLIALYVTLEGALSLVVGLLLVVFGFQLLSLPIVLICPAYIIFLLYRWQDMPRSMPQSAWHWKPIVSVLFLLLFVQLIVDHMDIVFQAIRISQIGEWGSIEGEFVVLITFVVQFIFIGWFSRRFFAKCLIGLGLGLIIVGLIVLALVPVQVLPGYDPVRLQFLMEHSIWNVYGISIPVSPSVGYAALAQFLIAVFLITAGLSMLIPVIFSWLYELIPGAFGLSLGFAVFFFGRAFSGELPRRLINAASTNAAMLILIGLMSIAFIVYWPYSRKKTKSVSATS